MHPTTQPGVMTGAVPTASLIMMDEPQQPLPPTSCSLSDDDDDDDMERELFGLTTRGLAEAEEDEENHGGQDAAAAAKEEEVAYRWLEWLVAESAAVEALTVDEGAGVGPGPLAMARDLLQGEYAAVVLESDAAAALFPPPDAGTAAAAQHADGLSAAEMMEATLRSRVAAYLKTTEGGAGASSSSSLRARATELLFLAAALLNLYLQANYTGPAPDPATLARITARLHPTLQTGAGDDNDNAAAVACALLEADGESPYPHALIPSALTAARLLLHCLTAPQHAAWLSPRPLALDGDGQPTLAPAPTTPDQPTLRRAGLLLAQTGTARVWALRALVTHRRALPGRRLTTALWAEGAALGRQLVEELQRPCQEEEKGAEAYDDRATRLWLEWGLAQHYFQEGDSGRAAFEHARAAAGLGLTLTARLGRRTKYQEKALPQMVLLAKSARVVEPAREEEGEEATVKPVASGHGPDSILLETTAFDNGEEGLEEGKLHPLEQAVVLALCLEVGSGQVRGGEDGGLTSEQMRPYVARVLEYPANWMVYSTALLERSWLDFESQYGRERAVLQIQALVDQHGSKLSSSSTVQEEEASAPAQERLRYLPTLAYPPQWELKRDLADRYAGMGVLASAADLYEELGLWDELVDCYKVLGRIARAEALVREQLAVRETANMWAALGDLTQDTACYEKAWALSKGRYPRAKRSLGRVAFREQRFAEAIQHFSDAVAVMPLVPDVWFLLGLAHMALERWEGALQAFTRVVQQEPDEARAWGNIAAVQMRLKDYERALGATKEAVRYLRDSQELWENYLTCAARTAKPSDVIYAFHRLLDLRVRHKANAAAATGSGKQGEQQRQPWTPDVAILELLVRQTVALTEKLQDKKKGQEGEGEEDEAMRVGQASLCKQVAELLGRVTSVITTEPRVWLAYAQFNEGAFPDGSRREQALDCRTRACRALTSKSGWEKEEAKVQAVVEALEGLVDAHVAKPTVAGLAQCDLFLKAPLRKLSEEGSPWASSPEQTRLHEAVQRLQAAMEEVRKAGQQAART